ncbi:hypothetical protein [Dongia sp.]|uniref:hypothetical protein n=1 Tax=Dongia sp. TaxID=1977262 RepID=UPI003751F1C2
MDFGLGSAIKGLPALLGVILGIRMYTGGLLPAQLCIGIAGGAVVSMLAGRGIMHRWPSIGRWLIEIWILAAVAMIAVATLAVLWLSNTSLIPVLGSRDPEADKTIASTFVGAVTAYMALLWTKDIGDGTGAFWPSTQFKRGMADAFKLMPNKPVGGSQLSEAMFEDVVEGYGDLGWGFRARGVRAKLLAAGL